MKRYLILLFTLLCMSFSLEAIAGRVSIQDNANVLSTADKNVLMEVGSRHPFDVIILTSSQFGSRSQFDTVAAGMLTSPNSMVIGLNPQQRFTVVRFGSGSGVPRNSYDMIASAGNSNFKVSNWKDGFTAIMNRSGEARASMAARTAATSSVQTTTTRTGFPWLTFFLIVAGVGFMGAFIWWLVRRESNRRYYTADYEYAGASVATPSYSSSYVAPGPTVVHTSPAVIHTSPTVIHHGSGGDFATGMMVGSMMNNGHHHHDVHHTTYVDSVPEPVYMEPAVVETDDSPTWDGGGSASSFESSDSGSSSSFDSNDSGSSSSYDSGGSSSSYGSGGSSSSFDSGSSSSSCSSPSSSCSSCSGGSSCGGGGGGD